MVNPEAPESDSDVAARVTVEIRLRAVNEVNEGAPVSEVAERYGVTRQTVTAWRKRYEAGGLDALADTRDHDHPRRWYASLHFEGARPATSALPPPPPAGPQSVQRRVPKDGVVMVAGQRLRVGRTHAGTIVTIVVDDHHFRVLDDTKELSLHARTSTTPIRNFNAHRPRKR